MTDPKDPFEEARQQGVTLNVTSKEGETFPLVLRLKDVRKTAKDWKTFSSDNPLMCVIHSEADVRGVRQLPLEIDPPKHTDYRALVQPLFNRPRDDADYISNMETLVDEMVTASIGNGEIEAVRQFALPLQSRALTRLLKMPESEADTWISWGVHVFHDRDDGSGEGHLLEAYTGEQIKKAAENPGDDFFSYLNQVEFEGRKLTFEEKQGFANVTFAGGRDTVINTIATIFQYFGTNTKALDFIREDESRIITAAEEFVRYTSPLTAITRKCPHATQLGEQEVPAGGRVGICWPSANRDETVFKEPNKVVLDRSPNPHIGFGFGAHNCLGAAHARLIFRSLLKSLSQQVEKLELIHAEPKIEEESSFTRQNGYESVTVRLHAKK